MGEATKVVKRKPRATKFYKVTMRILKTCLPYAKYTIIQGSSDISMTEPRPTLRELLDPFTHDGVVI